MKRSFKPRPADTEVGVENLELDQWENVVVKQSFHTMRNTGRIEQLEAKQADIERIVKGILAYHLDSLEWTQSTRLSKAASLSWADLAGMPDFVLESDDTGDLWLTLATPNEKIELTYRELPLALLDNVSKITKAFDNLEQDFDDAAPRITRCAVLEEELGAFEDALEDEQAEYLASCISVIRDVLDYNYAEDLSETHLHVLKKAIGLIHEKGVECNKEDYQNLHMEFLQSGLALLPTSRKAIEKYEAG